MGAMSEPMSSNRPFPELSGSEVAIAYAEAATGIALTASGDWFSGCGQMYTVVPSPAEAERRAAEFIRDHPEAECWFFDRSGVAFRRITATTDEARRSQ
jgi:hypothetical protein